MKSRSKRSSTRPRFLLCVSNGGYHKASFEPLKVYPSLADRDAARDGMVRVVDESGEDFLFPASLFAPVVVRGKARKAILAAYTASPAPSH
jgi:hypothetical protein